MIQPVMQGPFHVNALVWNSHTHIHAYSHCGQKQFQETSYEPTFGLNIPGLKMQ